MGGKKEVYRDVRFFHGAIQLYILRRHLTRLSGVRRTTIPW